MHPHLLALILAVSLASAQPTPATAEKKARLEGRALSTAGESVRKATIRLMGGPTIYTETTDNEGKFLFEDVAPGRYTLTAEKAGFVSGRYGARSTTSPGTQLSISAGQEVKDLVFPLTPQGVITGRVTDLDGDPVRNVQVMVLRTGYGGAGRRQFIPAGAASTDDQGNFRAGNLAPGRYYLSVLDRTGGYSIGVNERPGRATATPPESNVTTYYPQALDIAGATAIDVTAGAELAGYNIRLRKARTYSIRGKAVDASGAPPQNTLLRAVPKLDGAVNALPLMNGAMQPVRAPDASFEFRNLTPGGYIIQSVPGGNVNGNPVTQLTGRAEVTIADANVEGVVLQLGPGIEITGTLRVEGGDLSSLPPVRAAGFVQTLNAAGAPVPAGSSPSMRPSINLAEAENLSFGRPSTQIKEDGSFKIQAAPAAKYFVNLGALPEGTYVKSTRFGNQDVTHDLLDLTYGGAGTLEIVLSTKAADVSGVVRDDKGEALGGIPITVWPKTPDRGSSSSGIRSGSTDQNGSFKISGLAPGEYFAAAWDDPEPGLTQSPDFAAKFASDAAAVKLAESSRETVALKLIPRERIAAEAAKLP